MFATVFDGITRHSPEGLWFKRYAEQFGFAAAVEWRDSGRPLPEPGPGNLGDAFMVPPPAGARSRWSRDVGGKRVGASRSGSGEPKAGRGKAAGAKKAVRNRLA